MQFVNHPDIEPQTTEITLEDVQGQVVTLEFNPAPKLAFGYRLVTEIPDFSELPEEQQNILSGVLMVVMCLKPDQLAFDSVREDSDSLSEYLLSVLQEMEVAGITPDHIQQICETLGKGFAPIEDGEVEAAQENFIDSPMSSPTFSSVKPSASDGTSGESVAASSESTGMPITGKKSA